MNITYAQALELGGSIADEARRIMEGDRRQVAPVGLDYSLCRKGPNKTEQRFQADVESHVLRIVYEKLKFKLAGNTFYTPDYDVWEHPASGLTLVEIKGRGGFSYDDSKVKAKVAAALYPEFRWLMAWPLGGGWEVHEVTDRGIGRERISVAWIPGS